MGQDKGWDVIVSGQDESTHWESRETLQDHNSDFVKPHEGPKLQPYIGEHDVMLIENFLWDLQRYIDASASLKVEKVFITNLYLTRHAKSWWHLYIKDSYWGPIEN